MCSSCICSVALTGNCYSKAESGESAGGEVWKGLEGKGL